MSYDIYLKDPVTKETAEVLGHLMRGGHIWRIIIQKAVFLRLR